MYKEIRKNFSNNFWKFHAQKASLLQIKPQLLNLELNHTRKSSQTCWKWAFIWELDAMDVKRSEKTQITCNIMFRSSSDLSEYLTLFHSRNKKSLSHFLWLNQSFIDLIASHHTDRLEYMNFCYVYSAPHNSLCFSTDCWRHHKEWMAFDIHFVFSFTCLHVKWHK